MINRVPTYRRRRRRLRPQFVLLVILLVITAADAVLLTGRLLQRLLPAPEQETRQQEWAFFSRSLPGEDVAVPEHVEEDFLPVNKYSRPGTALKEINGVVIHYVGNPGTTAQANRNYFATLALGREKTYASAHFVVGLEGEVIQCIPLTEISHASNTRNEDTVAIEVCHPDEGGEFTAVTYAATAELTAWLCETFELDPTEDVIRHYDVTGKECPRYYVKHPEAWEQFLEDVAEACDEKSSEG